MADSSVIKNCYLRKATNEDIDTLYEWVNDPAVRQSAFNTQKIQYEEHVNWFNQMIQDPNKIQYIMMRDKTPIGQIRLTIEGECVDIDYSISKKYRGVGYGREIVRLAMDQVRLECPNVKKMIGRVKPTNDTSRRCFIRNGFQVKFQQLDFDL